MKDYEDLYTKNKEEFENYQNFAESTIQILNEKNTKLERKLDSLTNIVEVSKYINSNISDDNLISMINDMIIGILGVIYSSIYIKEGDRLVIKASNKPDLENYDYENEIFTTVEEGEPFVLNCREAFFKGVGFIKIHSIIGIPIQIRDIFIGYIIVEHSLYDFFNYDHIKFISSIANQIGIALENNNLYNKVKENSIRDPLLGIYNRRYFFDVVENIISKNPEKKLGIVMMDIDNFKKVNDIFGHQFGDKILVNTTDILSSSLNKGDIVARYGGEEIVIYIDEVSDQSKVFKKIDKMRFDIANSIVELNGVTNSVTCSFGLSFYPDSADTLSKVINVADNMLYEAKRYGKNKAISG
ncbi:MAG TPA: sensor domain-containing diguanylate cyclase [Clostridiaceae bacterium]